MSLSANLVGESSPGNMASTRPRSEEHTSELQSRVDLVCRLLLEKKKPTKLYVIMPPNLGGFFMDRSSYPSECHAEYFDMERVEALKSATTALCTPTLSQSPRLSV